MSASLSQAVESDHLLAHLRALEGERYPTSSPERLERAQRYVLDHWNRWALRVSSDEFTHDGARFLNWLARPIQHPDGPRLIIGAHVDTAPGTPGADDNASGVAALLEVSRVTAAAALRVPVEFVLFNLEELGMLGSTHYAQHLRRAGTALLGMLSLEMIGFTETTGLQHYPWFLRGRFPAQGTYLGLAANARSRTLLDHVARAMGTVSGLAIEQMALPGDGRMFPEACLSDHAPFWDCGYPALLVTDTAFFRNPHYHKPTDTVETLDLAFLTNVTRGLAAVVEQLAAA